MAWEVQRDTWPGAVTLLARISVHTEQICGLAWSADGNVFSSGGNDNLCCLFEVDKILSPAVRRRHRNRGRGFSVVPRDSQTLPSPATTSSPDSPSSPISPISPTARTTHPQSRIVTPNHRFGQPTPETKPIPIFTAGTEVHRFDHAAAVKAMAFCPWHPSILATGGGSKDKCIHFFDTRTGAALATIAVSAQVTSLIWNERRREIAATFGFTQPEHEVRIAVFAWPECCVVGEVRWDRGAMGGDIRALCGIRYPGTGDVEDTASLASGSPPSAYTASARRRSGWEGKEGCIVVAASDESVKFHEIWGGEGGGKLVLRNGGVGGGREGVFGVSDLFEGLEGIDNEGEMVIR